MLICPITKKLCLDEECGVHKLVFSQFIACKKVNSNDIYFMDKDGNCTKINNKSEQEK